MTAWNNSLTDASSACEKTWRQIDWQDVKRQVRRLQMRIAKATQQGKYGKAKSLQWILTHSYYAKLLAVKRVTENTGAKTPGVDKVIWKTPEQKYHAARSLKRRGYQSQPLRRIYIPKRNGKQRPLGIPTMKDRAMQALHLLALEPISEIKADKHSYGFRPERSTADAIEQCFILLARKDSPQWILEADIKACFDEISHIWLIENIPMDKTILQKWLKAGYFEKDMFYETQAGTPQGGIISPTISNMALDGLKEAIEQTASKTNRVNMVRYADDFIITGKSKEVLEKTVKPAVIKFLAKRGLILSEDKTLVTHIEQGFDFLGFNIRKYNGKLLIKPSKESIKTFLDTTRTLIKSNPMIKTESLIRLLNPKLRGWANYYRHVVSKQIFSKVDEQMFKALFRWTKRRHPNKGAKWRQRKYFHHPPPETWWFHAKIYDKENHPVFIRLVRMAKVKIKRHIKIKADATPYDPAFIPYFEQRKNRYGLLD